MDDSFFINLALREAWRYQILTYPNPAVGAVVVRDGKILSIEAHQMAGASHSEVRALVSAYERVSGKEVDFDKNDAALAHKFLKSLPKSFFRDCEVYVTLEPCSHSGKTPSCANLLKELKPKRVVIATTDPIESHSGGVEILKQSGVEVVVGVEEKRAKDLIEPFVIWQKRTFVLFKLAQSLNGKIGGGYLSSRDSLTFTHKIREVVDYLLIGGNTVKVDRPTLDCRFSNPKKAPDIKIYSKSKEFDKSIPLFGVNNRGVEIIDTLEFKSPGAILVEGGEGMLRALADKIDWFLINLTPKLSDSEISYNFRANLEFLFELKVGKDYMIWSRFGQAD